MAHIPNKSGESFLNNPCYKANTWRNITESTSAVSGLLIHRCINNPDISHVMKKKKIFLTSHIAVALFLTIER